MKKTGLLVIAIFCLAKISFSQVTIAGSSGADGTYASLTNPGGAFDVLDAGATQAGNTIIITITSDLTGETGSFSLDNKNWVTLFIIPVGNRTVTGAKASGGLIVLNNVQNVVIDGQNAGGNSLSISNSSTSNTAGTSTIQLIASSDCKITNCTVLGSSTGAAGTTTPATATIYLQSSASGCDHDTISNNNITNDAAGLPSMAIAGYGASAVLVNTNNLLKGNNIYDWYNINGSAAINLGQFNASWTIEDNKLYQSAPRSGMTTGTFFRFIYINSSTGGGHAINNNIMGYANASGTGMLTNTSGRLRGIEMTVASNPVSSVQGNTINNINWTTDDAVTGYGAGATVCLFLLAGGAANIGNISSNTLGDMTTVASATSGIYITSASTTIMGINSIYISGTATCILQNNLVGAIKGTGPATSGFLFDGIVITGDYSHTVTNNSIGSSVASSIEMGVSGITTATTSITAILNLSSGVANTVTIGSAGAGNTIQNISANGSLGSSFTGIYNAAAPGTLNINNNIFAANTLAGTGNYNIVFNQSSPATAMNINNNTVMSAVISAASYPSIAAFIMNAGGNALGCAVSISNNSFAGLSFTGITGSTNTVYCIYNQGTVASVAIDNNNFNDLSIKTSGSVYFCYNNNVTTSTASFSNNYITNGFSKTVAGGAFMCYFDTGNPTGGTATINGNNFSNITLTGATSFTGIHHQVNTSQVILVTNNTFNTITAGTSGVRVIYTPGGALGSTISGNTLASISSGSSTMTGIWFGNITAPLSMNCYNNNIHGFSSTGTGNTYGILSGSGVTVNIYKNKIYDLQADDAAATVTGIYVAGSSSSSIVSVYNNLIGNLGAPSSSSSSPAVTGINLSPAGSNSSARVYYNTVYLNASSAGANFSTAGVYHSANIVSTIASLDMRNNIIMNASVPSGSGNTVAFYRSAGTTDMLNNYVNSSNNNLFYPGNVALGNRYIYYDGVSSLSDIALYRGGIITAGTINPRDVNSVTEDLSPVFISTSGASANFLHINTGIPTQVEKGAIPVAGITDDFDSDARDVNLPDIGADEGNFLSADLVGPVISYTPLANVACSTPVTLLATMSDATGINTTPGTRPRVYFRKTSNANALGATNTSTTNGWKYSEATNTISPFSFTIDHTLLFGGVAPADVIEYFVVAQDITVLSNSTIYTGVPANALSGPTPVALTSAAFAMQAPINSYTINGSSNLLAGVTGGPQVCSSNNVLPSGTYYADGSCNLIAKVVPSGATPVAGSINTCVKVDATTMFYNSEPYMMRHFDVEPISGASTARITLYALQTEFDNYNTNCGGFPKLPISFADVAGIANLRITQCHGIPTQPAPGYYPGSSEIIDPADVDIVWNTIREWWEISFDVSSFSGFFIHTTVMGFPLPAHLISFNGKRQGATNILTWKVLTEQNVRGYEVQRSYNGQTFSSIGFVNSLAPGGNSADALQYSFTDNNFSGDRQYYRLKETGNDGRVTTSPVVLIKNVSPSSLVVKGISPNPVNDFVNVIIESPLHNQLTIILSDISGHIIQTKKIAAEQGTTIIPFNTEQLAAGTYLLKINCDAGCEGAVSKFIKQ